MKTSGENAETIIHSEDDKLIIQRKFDIEPVLKDIADLKSVSSGKSPTGELYHVGRIPAAVIEHYCNTKGITFHDFLVDTNHVKNLMNDSEFKHLRIWEGTM